MRRSKLSYANVVATLALFVALGGGAYAASKISGKDIKNSSVTGKDVKNRSLGARDLKRNVLRTGPTGPAGAAGLPGRPGAPGRDGVGARSISRTWAFGADGTPVVLAEAGGVTLIGTCEDLGSQTFRLTIRADTPGDGYTLARLWGQADDELDTGIEYYDDENRPVLVDATGDYIENFRNGGFTAVIGEGDAEATLDLSWDVPFDSVQTACRVGGALIPTE